MSDSFYESWIGKDIDYEQLWSDYNRGQDYIKKFETVKPSLLEIIFDFPRNDEALFNHDAIYKSFKGLYHDFKLYCLSHKQYHESSPIFLYSIKRSSAEWSFLLDSDLISIFSIVLALGMDKYNDYKNSERHNEIMQELEKIRNKIDVPSEKLESFVQVGKYEVIFKNLVKFKPTTITIKKFSSGFFSTFSEELIIDLDKDDEKKHSS